MSEECNVGVPAAGMTGAQLARRLAMSGHPVVMKEVSMGLTDRGKPRVTEVIGKSTAKEEVA